MEKQRKNVKDPITSGTVSKTIQQALMDKLLSLDLSYLNITEIPSTLISLHQLQHLYLKGNTIESLPEDFFIELRSLLWLDLRCNRLQSLPVSVGQHKHLKNLLLGDNKLEYLPAELALVTTLTGLNLVNNPLVDPPQHIVDKGIHEIKVYFLSKLGIKDTSKKLDLESDDETSDPTEAVPQAVQPCKVSLKEKWKNSSMEYSRSYSEEGLLRPRDSSGSYCYNTALMHSYDLKCDINGPNVDSGSPCWFIHRPWTTGVFFTRTKNHET